MTDANIKINNRIDYKDNPTLRAQKTTKVVNKTLVYAFLVLIALFILIPFYWMINVSFWSTHETVWSVEISIFPREFTPGNYLTIIQAAPTTGPLANVAFPRFLFNTFVVAFFSTTIGTLFAIIVAFALAKLNFKGRELVFTLMLATMMIPSEMFVVTNFMTVAALGWRNVDSPVTYFALIIPFTVSVFQVFLLRQTFRQVPNELYYAAKVDGCRDWKYLWTVMVPMAKSSIITIVILRVMGSWNAFSWPQLVAHPRFRLITNWLRGSFRDPDQPELGNLFNLQMAATVVVTVPLLILFIFARKYIMSGISRSGVKG